MHPSYSHGKQSRPLEGVGMARWPQPSDGACEVVQSQIDGISLVTIQLVHMVSAAQLPSSASVPTLLRYHREGGGREKSRSH